MIFAAPDFFAGVFLGVVVAGSFFAAGALLVALADLESPPSSSLSSPILLDLPLVWVGADFLPGGCFGADFAALLAARLDLTGASAKSLSEKYESEPDELEPLELEVELELEPL